MAELGGHLDAGRAAHLRSALLLREADLTDRLQVPHRAALAAALRVWVEPLDQPEYGEPGYLTGLGLDPACLADTLATRIAEGIRANGRAGGALGPLAEWWWREEFGPRFDAIEQSLAHLRDLHEPRHRVASLPGVTPRFTGRGAALAELGAHICAHEPDGTVETVLAVVGMAGVGKTQLALRAAHEHKHRYPDGQYFVDLHGYTDGIAPVTPVAALEELLRQAGLTGQQIPSDLAGRQARWRALLAGQRALVLLDNALDARQVRPVLPKAASCLVLVTSRSRLTDLPGAGSMPLDVLSVDEAIALFCRLSGTDPRTDWSAVRTIVTLVGRLPVAIEAAAGQIHDDLTVAEFADDLRAARSARHFTTDLGPLGPSVSAALSTSVDRLDPPLQTAFRLLGLHPGPRVCGPQFAALSGASADEARAILHGLATRHLIRVSGGPAARRGYELHDLVREFARREAGTGLSAAQRAAAVDRLVTWYGTAMSDIWHLRRTPPRQFGATGAGLGWTDPRQAQRWLADEQENLLALAEVVTGGTAATVLRRAAEQMHAYGFHATARTLHTRAAAGSAAAGDRPGEAAARQGLGEVERVTGDYPAAIGHYHAARALCAARDDVAGAAHAHRGLGEVALMSGDLPGATRELQLALSGFDAAGDPEGASMVRRILGEVARAAGDNTAAVRHFQAAQAGFAAAGNRDGEAYARLGLADVALGAGEHASARAHFTAARRGFAAIGNRDGEAYARMGVGEVARATGDHDAAYRHLRAAYRSFRRIGDREGAAHSGRLRRSGTGGGRSPGRDRALRRGARRLPGDR
ncbi:NB-ARC domain-containing protein [Micromonospora sp. C95]|uniref:ATP-binding protein n=1 Tax=Micromonospora sp. C95 TaxID=2824882 RepID=UPI001B37BF2C|nr:NB-ARC domain-containing protein [Micromonospora sp. C95]MBQ1023793.1 hypothetical protein [Micromonospora sp. C95]